MPSTRFVFLCLGGSLGFGRSFLWRRALSLYESGVDRGMLNHMLHLAPGGKATRREVKAALAAVLLEEERRALPRTSQSAESTDLERRLKASDRHLAFEIDIWNRYVERLAGRRGTSAGLPRHVALTRPVRNRLLSNIPMEKILRASDVAELAETHGLRIGAAVNLVNSEWGKREGEYFEKADLFDVGRLAGSSSYSPFVPELLTLADRLAFGRVWSDVLDPTRQGAAAKERLPTLGAFLGELARYGALSHDACGVSPLLTRLHMLGALVHLCNSDISIAEAVAALEGSRRSSALRDLVKNLSALGVALPDGKLAENTLYAVLKEVYKQHANSQDSELRLRAWRCGDAIGGAQAREVLRQAQMNEVPGLPTAERTQGQTMKDELARAARFSVNVHHGQKKLMTLALGEA